MCLNMYTCVLMCVCVAACTCEYVHVCSRVCVCVCEYEHICVYICAENGSKAGRGQVRASESQSSLFPNISKVIFSKYE